MIGPSPDLIHPMPGFEDVTFIKNVIKNPNIIVGDYSYYYDSEDSINFERNVLFHYPFIGDKLIIGKFCVINRGTIFIMNGAGVSSECVSMFPFYVFAHGWEKNVPIVEDLTIIGDTIIHNDVWLGADSVVMPGVEIGNGAVVATRAVVTEDVEPYTVVAGNPAKVVKKRFSEDTIEMLLGLRWWDWPTDKISQYIHVLNGGNTFALSQLYALSILDDHPMDSPDFLGEGFDSPHSFSSSDGMSNTSSRSGLRSKPQIDLSKLSSFIAASSNNPRKNSDILSELSNIYSVCQPDSASEYGRRADDVDNCLSIDESDFNASTSHDNFDSNDLASPSHGKANKSSLTGAVRSAIKKMKFQDDGDESSSDYSLN